MAKGTTGKALKQDIRQVLPEQQEILRDLGKQKAEVEKIKQSYDKLNESLKNTTTHSSTWFKLQGKITDLLRQYDGDVQNLLHNLGDVNGAFENQKKRIKTLKSEMTDYVDKWGELEGLQASITNEYGRQSIQAKSLDAVVEKTKAQYNGITSILNSNTDIQGHQKEVILQALDTYKNFPVVLNGLQKQLKRNEISAEGFNESIIKAGNQFSDLINQLDIMVPGIKEIKDLLDELPGTMQKNVEAAEAMKKQFDKIDAAGAVGNFAVGGIPGASDLIKHGSDIRKDSLAGSDLKTLSIIGLVIAAMELQAALEGKSLARGEAQTEIIKKQLDYRMQIAEARVQVANNLPETKALMDFSYELKGLQNQFAATSQTALFGKAIGQMPYATEQMELAGVGVESVMSAMHDLSKTANMGIFPQLAANAAVFAKKMGISTSELGTQIGLYRQLNKVGAEDAMKGAQYQISVGTIDPTTFSTDMADASKLAMYYNIKSYQTLVKQVQAVRLMGSSWAAIAEDGKNMVLNYKDSIKSEMELSAMLGERVDLSEVRSLIAANDIEGAQKAFNATGLAQRARAQGMFSVDMLQKAVGPAIQAGALAAPYQQGPKLNTASNAGFLQSFQDSMKNLKIATAYLEINKAVDVAGYEAEETRLIKSDSKTLDIAGQIKQQDAAAFLRKVSSILSAPGGLAQDMYDKLKESAPYLVQKLLPKNVPGGSDAGKMIEGIAETLKLDLYPNIKSRDGKRYGSNHHTGNFGNMFDLMGPGPDIKGGSFGAGASIRPLTPSNGGSGVQYQATQQIQQEKIIQDGKIQQEQLANLNSHTETSVELLKSLRDLTAIMLDPDRKKDFNVQLNMDGKQIKNVLIRNNERDLGTTRDGLTFSTQGAKS